MPSLILLFLFKLLVAGDINIVRLQIYDPQLLDLSAVPSVLLEDRPKHVINREKLSLQDCFDLLTVLLKDVAAPHLQDRPGSEVFEEVLAPDLSVISSLKKPLLKRCVLDWHVIFVERKSFLGQSVKLVTVIWAGGIPTQWLGLLVRCGILDQRLQVIGVFAVWSLDAVNEVVVILGLLLKAVDHLVKLCETHLVDV